MVSDQNLANVVGGKTARACDNCIRKRARWFCAADDAFLCQACDTSVHSANPLARRHERVRLKTASLKSFDESHLVNLLPTWQKGFTKKPRTPRHRGKHGVRAKSEESVRNFLHLVPEIGADENSTEENEEQEQLLYRVPIFDPFVEQYVENNGKARDEFGGELKGVLQYDCDNGVNSSNGIEPSDMDLADFAADVETLLGKGLDEESFDMEGLGLLDYKEKDSVKVEDEDDMEAFMADHIDTEMDMTREPFELNFDFESPEPSGEKDEKVVAEEAMENNIDEYRVREMKKKSRKILLRLNYDGVINSWSDQRSPWTSGDRPELDSSDCWPDCLGSCGAVHNPYVDLGVISGHSALMVDGGREARVSRYREKRRTRLFSKKIRYEVRKLNAEKRPRMKGRFVKRSSFSGPDFSLLNISK